MSGHPEFFSLNQGAICIRSLSKTRTNFAETNKCLPVVKQSNLSNVYCYNRPGNSAVTSYLFLFLYSLFYFYFFLRFDLSRMRIRTVTKTKSWPSWRIISWRLHNWIRSNHSIIVAGKSRSTIAFILLRLSIHYSKNEETLGGVIYSVFRIKQNILSRSV